MVNHTGAVVTLDASWNVSGGWEPLGYSQFVGSPPYAVPGNGRIFYWGYACGTGTPGTDWTSVTGTFEDNLLSGVGNGWTGGQTGATITSPPATLVATQKLTLPGVLTGVTITCAARATTAWGDGAITFGTPFVAS